jgi:hypothetical protein
MSVWAGVIGWKCTCEERKSEFPRIFSQMAARSGLQVSKRCLDIVMKRGELYLSNQSAPTDRIVDFFVRAPKRLCALLLLLHFSLASLSGLSPLPEPFQFPEPLVLVFEGFEFARGEGEVPERVARGRRRGDFFARVDAEPFVGEGEGEGPTVREVPPHGQDHLARSASCCPCTATTTSAEIVDPRQRDRLDECAGLVIERVDVEVQLGEQGRGWVAWRERRTWRRGRVRDGEGAGEEPADGEQVGIGEAHPAAPEIM